MNLKEFVSEKYPEIVKVINPLNQKQKLFDDIYVWNSKYWKKIDPLTIETFCFEKLIENEIDKESVQKHLIKQFLSEILIEDTDIDSEYLFCIEDGVVDITTILKLKSENRELHTCKELWLRPHEEYKDNFITMYSDLNYIAPNDRDLSFIKEMLSSQLLRADEMYDYFFDFLSSLLINDNRKRQFFEFWGKKATGKTTIVSLIVSLLGSYASVLPEGMLTDKQSDFSSDLYDKRKKILLVYSETGNKRVRTSLLKRITGKAFLEAKGISFIVKSKIIIDSNFILKPDNVFDDAFEERRVIIPFVNTIPEDKRVPNYDEKLIVKKNDLFSEMIDRIPNYFNSDIIKPSVSKEIEEKEKRFNNPVKYFYESCCSPTNVSCDINSKDLYSFFSEYFHYVFTEMLKIDEIEIFEENEIKNVLNISQNIFNKDIIYLHKKFSRTNDRIILKNLELKFEKKYWGNSLEVLRNNSTNEELENILREIKNAKGKCLTFDMPLQHIKKLNAEIKEETVKSCLNDGIYMLLMADYLNNTNNKIMEVDSIEYKID